MRRPCPSSWRCNRVSVGSQFGSTMPSWASECVLIGVGRRRGASAASSSPGVVGPGRVRPCRVAPGDVAPGHRAVGNGSPMPRRPGHVAPGDARPGCVRPGCVRPGRRVPGLVRQGGRSPRLSSRTTWCRPTPTSRTDRVRRSGSASRAVRVDERAFAMFTHRRRASPRERRLRRRRQHQRTLHLVRSPRGILGEDHGRRARHHRCRERRTAQLHVAGAVTLRRPLDRELTRRIRAAPRPMMYRPGAAMSGFMKPSGV